MCKKHSRNVIVERIKAAEAAEQLFYSTDTPCSKCGFDLRYVKTRGCRGCAVIKKRKQRELIYKARPCAVELLIKESGKKSLMRVLHRAFQPKVLN